MTNVGFIGLGDQGAPMARVDVLLLCLRDDEDVADLLLIARRLDVDVPALVRVGIVAGVLPDPPLSRTAASSAAVTARQVAARDALRQAARDGDVP
ncbi:hypothetical protein [Micromonospora humi]|uniref:Uncharacterized protein n=1 Tax=Micromonospora humi TaxID=745366 RepID=A0A1C5K4G4_9ACTN|nr:hypothetical protein [Micromonospora humi]SCG77429.1 hypothetical protein GA0070213_11851 [Micromonospora humi]